LKKAQLGGYALPLFDTVGMSDAEGVINAFSEKKAPGIIALWNEIAQQPNTPAFLEYIRSYAIDHSSPLSLMLDHGTSVEMCLKALDQGFIDVMYDGSALPLEENIANTRQVVEAAHAKGAAVEAELGHVGQGDEYASFGAKGQGFTEPAAVEQFVAETGVDILAVAIGTAHGNYQKAPELDLELLAEIRMRCDVPLALHGGSGLSDDQFRAAIKAGICKINVFTDLAEAAFSEVRQAVESEKDKIFGVSNAVRASFCRRCAHHIDIFGAAEKG
jgi:fructose-bisphosphate aldolase class II